GVRDFLLAGVERVAGCADVEVEVLAQRGARLDLVAAAAGRRDGYVIRMNIGFHDGCPRVCWRSATRSFVGHGRRVWPIKKASTSERARHDTKTRRSRKRGIRYTRAAPESVNPNRPMPTILRVAVPSPLRQLFDYLPPAELAAPLSPGQRIEVPFCRRP